MRPTGAGESAISQIADSLIPGAIVVISPLIAFHPNQAGAIARRRVGFTMLEGWEHVMRREPALDATCP